MESGYLHELSRALAELSDSDMRDMLDMMPELDYKRMRRIIIPKYRRD